MPMNKKLMYLCAVGMFLLLNAMTTALTDEHGFPQLSIITESQGYHVMAVEEQVGAGDN